MTDQSIAHNGCSGFCIVSSVHYLFMTYIWSLCHNKTITIGGFNKNEYIYIEQTIIDQLSSCGDG